MAFVDELTITARAGNGGNGVVRWRHDKGKEYGGPSGGNGGAGGDVVVRAVRDLQVLARYRSNPTFAAKAGDAGFRDDMTGKDGAPAYIEVPVGAYIVNVETGARWEVLTEGEEYIILKGGRGGLGNAHYKSSTNQYPTEATPGESGEVGTFDIEIRLIADVGIVGLPNAGKSSLLNAITHAKAKVGAYQFTTLEPNLGVFHSYILADIPGLIEGAHQGKGLGDKFLRHIRRTRAILHCVSAEEENPSRIYEIVRSELASYDPTLAEKSEIIFLTKADMVSPEVLAARQKELSRFAPVATISVLDDALVKAASDRLVAFLAQHP